MSGTQNWIGITGLKTIRNGYTDVELVGEELWSRRLEWREWGRRRGKQRYGRRIKKNGEEYKTGQLPQINIKSSDSTITQPVYRQLRSKNPWQCCKI